MRADNYINVLNDLKNLPIWLRLPKSGQRCVYTGFSRSAINELILPSSEYPIPRVASVSLKKPHEIRGIRLVKTMSLLTYLDEMLSANSEQS